MKIYTPLEKGLGNWIENSIEVNTLEEADVVLAPGGSDIQPEYYNHTPIKGCHYNPKADEKEYDLLQKAIKSGKLIVGTCKSAQWLTVLAGGWLIQDVDGHHGHHKINTWDDQSFTVNSSHHQMCYPYDLPKEDYQILGWSAELSSKYIIGNGKLKLDIEDAVDENGYFKEPEAIYYPKIRGLGLQFHNEWGTCSKECDDWVNQIIKFLLVMPRGL